MKQQKIKVGDKVKVLHPNMDDSNPAFATGTIHTVLSINGDFIRVNISQPENGMRSIYFELVEEKEVPVKSPKKDDRTGWGFE